MVKNLVLSFVPFFAIACGGAGSETPPSTTAATSASATPATASTASAAADTNAAAASSVGAAWSTAVIAIPNPADPGDKAHPLHIDAPSGATVQVSGTTVNVLAGAHFGMAVVEQGSADLHETVKSFGTPQSSVQNAHVEKIKDDLLVYTGTDLGRAGYHFEAFVQTANPAHSYACSDSGLLKVELTREDVDTMIRACKTLKR